MENTCGILENRVMGKIIDPEGKDEVGGYKILSNEKLHNLQAYSSPNTIRDIKSEGHYWGTYYSLEYEKYITKSELSVF
jgi:hypothetical protein